MWIMTTKGFISAVAHRDKPGFLMVRARNKAHLEQLTDKPEDIYQVTPADYPWRVEIIKAEFNAKISDLILNLDYDNFKNAVPDPGYHNMLSRVWSAGYHYGQEVNYKPGETCDHCARSIAPGDPWCAYCATYNPTDA